MAAQKRFVATSGMLVLFVAAAASAAPAPAPQDIADLKEKAEAAFAGVRNFDRGQGLGALLDDADAARIAAKTLFDNGAFAEAKAAYLDLLVRCEKLKVRDRDRAAAWVAKRRADLAASAARSARAETEARDSWQSAAKSAETAAADYEAARFVEAESAWRAAADSYDRARPDPRVKTLAISLDTTQAAVAAGREPRSPDAERVRVRVWAEGEKKVFRAGEAPRFCVTVDRDAYVYLFDIRPDGKTVMIFPNAYHRDNFIKAGETVTVPSGDMEFHFTIQEPFGPEAVQAVATPSRLVSQEVATRGFDPPKTVENPFRDVAAGTRGLADAIRDIQTRGIGVVPNAPKPAWDEDHWAFVTEK